MDIVWYVAAFGIATSYTLSANGFEDIVIRSRAIQVFADISGGAIAVSVGLVLRLKAQTFWTGSKRAQTSYETYHTLLNLSL